MPDPLADLSSTVTELPATTSTPNTLDSSSAPTANTTTDPITGVDNTVTELPQTAPNPVSTTSTPSNSTDKDPITSMDNSAASSSTTDSMDYTNTSNGNQIAVLSALDYSTNQETYYLDFSTSQEVTSLDHSTNSEVTNTNLSTYESTSNIDNSVNLQIGSLDNSTHEATNNANYSTHQEVNHISITLVSQQIPNNTTMLQPTAPAASPTSSAADGVTSSQAANGADSSLRRSGHRYRLGSRHFFGQTNGRWRVDRLLDFRAADGDQLQLSRRFFKGIGELEFRSVDSRRELRLAARSDDDILYFEPKGCLYLNANGADQGFGRRGGLFAILENSPTLSSDHLQIG